MAKKLRGNTATPTSDTGRAVAVAPSNVTDDAIREHIQICAHLRSALDEASGTYRAALKAAKKDGIEPADIVWYLGAKQREVDDIDNETRRRNRIAKLMGLPLGSQLGLFEGGGSVATATEDADPAMAETSAIIKAKKRGYDDGFDGKTMDPAYEPGSSVALAYESEWKRAQAELARKMFRGKKGRVEKPEPETAPPVH